MAENTNHDQAVLLEQWKTCVEAANSISQRRDAMNNLMATISIAVLAAISILWDAKSLILSFAGIALCMFWIRLIHYYKRLNTAKYDVILELEQSLPAQPFKDEWGLLCAEQKHREGTKLETWLPIAFAVAYAVIIVVIIVMRFIL